MNTNGTVRSARHWLLLPGVALSALTANTWAQQAPAAATPEQLLRYDVDKNGRLDPAELATMEADRAKTPAVPASPDAASAESAVQLSPFEVRGANTGYYASNTMSGTRLNTKLEDIGSSISVVTKQQMADFAMLDINDIFNYESSTEGTGNYTAFEVDRNGMVTDQIQDNPQGSNRIRGMGAANISLSGFAVSGRAPIDPINIDAVEISRGPNSSIFGLGEGSGTVNMVASSANITRESTSAEFRVDDIGGWRTSLDVNRPVPFFRGKAAVRLSGVYQHDEFRQKPSGFDTRRLNLMLRLQPFKYTSIRGSFSTYRGEGTRATAITPRDAVTFWKNVGSPAWDPIANAVTVNGVTTVMTGTANPLGLAGPAFAQPALYVDRNGIQLWQVTRLPAATATNGPNNTGGTTRLLESLAEPVRTGAPLFSTLPGVSNKGIYDYSSINLGAPNTIEDKVDIATVEFDQTFLQTEQHQIAFQFAWQREDADRINRNFIGRASATSNSFYLYIDPNTRLLDGSPNPYFGRPYLGVGEPVTEDQPLRRDAYRGQLAYLLDLTKSQRVIRHLGRHQFLGYYEERQTASYRYRFRDVMINDNPIYAPAGQPKGNQSGTTAPLATRGYYHFLVGDNQGQNVDYGPGGFGYGQYPFRWFNPATSTWVTDTATLGLAGIQEGTAGGNGVLNLIKTKGAMWQGYLFKDRVVVTLGMRTDENRNKNQNPSRLMPNGYSFDYAAMDGWVGDWRFREGDTKTQGVVVKPFRDWGWVERTRSRGGWKAFGADLLNGLTVYYNKSDSFRPETPALNILLEQLENPTSTGEDYGFTLNIGSKFVLRANRYETEQVDSRTGQGGTFATRVLRVDFAPIRGENDPISLQRQARNWITAANPTFTADQTNTAVAGIMQIPAAAVAVFNSSEAIAETSDVVAKGDEYELSYNPTDYWTLRANLTRSISIDKNLSPNIPAWVNERLPVWDSIVDPRSGAKWLDTIYQGDTFTGVAPTSARPGNGIAPTNGTPAAFLINNVYNPLKIASATEGKSRPQVREWRFNLNTAYRLAGITDQKYLKRMTIGGGVRWEDKAAIGYYGIPINGSMTAALELDPDRPIYDKARAYFDVFASYNTRLFGDKVRARFQLNVRNVHESHARLQPVGAYPDGRAHTFRIVDPRTFIFTTTFDL
jgi:outer membrane receptor for ferric coprogen and ferric-rhodotorulic acid